MDGSAPSKSEELFPQRVQHNRHAHIALAPVDPDGILDIEIPPEERSGEFLIPVLADENVLEPIVPPSIPQAATRARSLAPLKTAIAEGKQKIALVSTLVPDLCRLYEQEGQIERASIKWYAIKRAVSILDKYNLLDESIQNYWDAYARLYNTLQLTNIHTSIVPQQSSELIQEYNELAEAMNILKQHESYAASKMGDAQFRILLLQPHLIAKRKALEKKIADIRAPKEIDIARLETRLHVLEKQRKSLGEISIDECVGLTLDDITPLTRSERAIAMRVSRFMRVHEHASPAETEKDLVTVLKSEPEHLSFLKLYYLFCTYSPKHSALTVIDGNTDAEDKLITKMAQDIAYKFLQNPEDKEQVLAAACTHLPRKNFTTLKARLMERVTAITTPLEKTWGIRQKRLWDHVGPTILQLPAKKCLPLTPAEKLILPAIEAAAHQVRLAVTETVNSLARHPENRATIVREQAATLAFELRPKFWEVLKLTPIPRSSQVPTVAILPPEPTPKTIDKEPTIITKNSSKWPSVWDIAQKAQQAIYTLGKGIKKTVQAISLPKVFKTHWFRWGMASAVLAGVPVREVDSVQATYNEHMATQVSSTTEKPDAPLFPSFREHQWSTILRVEDNQVTERLNFASTTTFTATDHSKNEFSILNKKFDTAHKDTDTIHDRSASVEHEVTSLSTASGTQIPIHTNTPTYFPRVVRMDHGPDNFVWALYRYMNTSDFTRAFPYYTPGELDQSKLFEWTQNGRIHHVLHYHLQHGDEFEFGLNANGDSIVINSWNRHGISMLHGQEARVPLYPLRTRLGPYSRSTAMMNSYITNPRQISYVAGNTNSCW